MSWHEHLQLEIVAEFRRFEGPRYWVLAEELGWVRRLIKRAEFCAARRWYRSTTQGKRAHNRQTADRWRRLRAELGGVVVGWLKCSVCGRQFERLALMEKTRASCSRSCWVKSSLAKRGQLLEYRGRSQSRAAWAKEFGVKHLTLNYRLRCGWDIERALTTPNLRPRKEA